jgi:ferredoxin-nitrite reductase
VPVNEEGDTVDGYHLLVGGGFGSDAAIARELWRDVKSEEAPARVEGLLKAWLAHRADDTETLARFTRRYEPDALRALVEDALEHAQ